ncbi:MAG: SDR family oxidoreductase [Gammaproteobacteria bacterium]|nr:SDR family oxidoreductase [Gammaproteobacteria bacterium]
MSTQEFADQVAVVTGGANGLGLSICELLISRGAKACIMDIDKPSLDSEVDRLNQGEGTARGYVMDVTDPVSIEQARDAILDEFGRVDVLVNNSGIYPHVTIDELTTDAWDKVFDINAKGVFLVTRAFKNAMIKQRSGRIVTIVSEDAFIPKPTIIHYAASKATLLSLVKTFAVEFAPHQVLCNGVAPGPIATERAKGQSWLVEQTKQIPIGRPAEPTDIAEVVLFLASPRNRVITGETVIANGGHYMIT